MADATGTRRQAHVRRSAPHKGDAASHDPNSQELSSMFRRFKVLAGDMTDTRELIQKDLLSRRAPETSTTHFARLVQGLVDSFRQGANAALNMAEGNISSCDCPNCGYKELCSVFHGSAVILLEQFDELANFVRVVAWRDSGSRRVDDSTQEREDIIEAAVYEVLAATETRERDRVVWHRPDIQQVEKLDSEGTKARWEMSRSRKMDEMEAQNRREIVLVNRNKVDKGTAEEEDFDEPYSMESEDEDVEKLPTVLAQVEYESDALNPETPEARPARRRVDSDARWSLVPATGQPFGKSLADELVDSNEALGGSSDGSPEPSVRGGTPPPGARPITIFTKIQSRSQSPVSKESRHDGDNDGSKSPVPFDQDETGKGFEEFEGGGDVQGDTNDHDVEEGEIVQNSMTKHGEDAEQVEYVREDFDKDHEADTGDGVQDEVNKDDEEAETSDDTQDSPDKYEECSGVQDEHEAEAAAEGSQQHAKGNTFHEPVRVRYGWWEDGPHPVTAQLAAWYYLFIYSTIVTVHMFRNFLGQSSVTRRCWQVCVQGTAVEEVDIWLAGFEVPRFPLHSFIIATRQVLLVVSMLTWAACWREREIWMASNAHTARHLRSWMAEEPAFFFAPGVDYRLAWWLPQPRKLVMLVIYTADMWLSLVKGLSKERIADYV
ncbi:hypothetical protein S40293_04526 [Stachybotrys chartarum IBT 40293]|nr:hypothetical protein S40293_04526 [Stachybotrys chartarum IBT 40293]